MAGTVPTWHQSVLALCLAWGPGALISHRCGAVAWRFARFKFTDVELIVPRNRRRDLPGIVHRPLSLPDVDRGVVEAIPVTTPARTLLDLASVVPPDAVEEALDDALRRGLLSLPRLRWRLKEVGGMGKPGTAVLRKLVEARSGLTTPKSVFERRWVRIMKHAGLPEPERQYEVRDMGSLIGRVDFAYPAAKLAIETDGHEWHSGRLKFVEDRARMNDLTRVGWNVVFVTWGDLDAPDRVLAVIWERLSLS